MIAKRIDRTSATDGFCHLAEYIAAARDKGEKLDALWIEGCDAGTGADDLALAIKEIEATQRQNRRSKSDKTYHLLVSFRDERPGPEALREIERAFAEALGFTDHQRVVATHKNTDNFHMHVAYNKIHPQTLRNRTPHRDFAVLEKTARELEQRFGLKIDRGMSDGEQGGLTPKARDMEAHTWQESFERQVLAIKPELMEGLTQARDWQALHRTLAGHGLAIRRRGNGLVIVDADGKQAIKASTLDRAWSAKGLKDRFGPYQAPEPKSSRVDRPRPRHRRRPLLRHPNNGRLWRRFLGIRSRPGHMAGMATWKQFLMLQLALDDPLAVAIIIYRQKMMETLFSPGGPPRRPAPPGFFPSSSSPPRERPAGSELRARWRAAKWADPKTTPHLVNAGVRGFGVKDEGGTLLIPARDGKGRIVDLFAIDGSGRGGFVAGDAHNMGLHHLIDPEDLADTGAPIVIAQDYATAAGLHQALRVPVAVAFAADELAPVAAAIRRDRPRARIVIAADPGNVVEASEAAAAVNGLVAAPPKGTFHDQARAQGPTAVRRALAEVLDDRAFLLWDKAEWSKIKGVKTEPDGTLLIPGRDLHGNLGAVYRAQNQADAPTLAAGPANRRDLVHVLDPGKSLANGAAPRIALATSIAEAAKIHDKEKIPVVTVLDPAGRGQVIEAVKRMWPGVGIGGRGKGRGAGLVWGGRIIT